MPAAPGAPDGTLQFVRTAPRTCRDDVNFVAGAQPGGRSWNAGGAADTPGLTSLRQGYGGPPKRFAKAEDPAHPTVAGSAFDRLRPGETRPISSPFPGATPVEQGLKTGAGPLAAAGTCYD
jgi:hypothetical protein